MTVSPPPIYDGLVDDQGKPKTSWTIFFNQVFDGDAGDVWLPTFQNLTVSGVPTIEGRVYRISKYLTFFRVTIIPSTSTTATAGSTYIDNYPIQFTNDGLVFAVTGNLGDGPGHIVANNNRIYVPAWSTITAPITLIGFGEAT